MKEWIILAILIGLLFGTIILPVIWTYYTFFSKKRDPMWLVYACLGTIVLLFADKMFRQSDDFTILIVIQFVMLACMVVDQWSYRIIDAREKEKDNADA